MRALELDGDELSLVAAALDGVTLDPDAYQASPSGFALADPPRRPFTLRLETRLNPAANTKLMGLYRSGSAYCTQCEAEGFRRITYFPDRPDVLSTYRVRLEADRSEAPVLLANGNLESAGEAEGGRHWAVWRDPFKKPCYLFAVVAGDLARVADSFVTMSGRRVALGVYVEHGREERAAYAMDALKRSMAWDERAFGREYDLDCFNIVAVSDFNMGAMENKGLNVFNDKYVLASPQTATDDDYAGIEGVIAHEYFHNWTGNRITCRDWFQLCLKEGLTVFRDQEFSADQRSAPVKRIADVRGLRAAQFAEDAGPLAHPVRPSVYHEINNFYTATVYQKGAELVRMLRALIGAEAFRAGMDLYFSRCDGTAATVEDFLACFAEVSGRDLTNFKLWYSQAGTPVLTVRTHWDEEQGTFRVDVAQSLAPTPGQPDKAPMTMPLALGLVDPEDGDVPLASTEASPRELGSGVFVLDGERRSIAFTGLKRRPALSFLRGFSAPVRVEDDLTEADLLTLLARDSDSFNRWQALQTLATRLLLRAVAAIRAGAKPAPEPAFVDAYGSVAADALAGRIDPAFAALALTLPSEGDLAREMAVNVDPDAIHRAREDLRGALGRAHAEALAALHATTADAHAVLARRGERRPPRAAQRRAGDGRRRQRGRRRRSRLSPDRRGRQHVDAARRAGGDRRHPRRAARARAASLRPPLRRRAADPRQMVRAAGADPRDRNARSRARADDAPRVLAAQPQPRAGVDRRLRRQRHPVQPRRRRRLRFPRRHRAGARSRQPAGGGAVADGDALVAVARTAASGAGRVGAAPHPRPAPTLRRRARHRRPVARLTRR